MRSVCLIILALFALTLVLPGLGLCAVSDEVVFYGEESYRPLVADAYQPEVAEIKTDGFVYFTIRTPAAGYSIAERESIVLQRLIEVMSSGSIAPVYVDEVRGAPTVYVGRFRIVTVYPADVVACGAANARALAEQWADGVRKGLLRTAPSACFGGSALYTVAIGNQVFFRLVDPMGYGNVRRRGQEVDRALSDIAGNFNPQMVHQLPAGPDGSITIQYGCCKPIVTVTPADAQPRGMTVQALADAWVANLKAGLPRVTGAICN